MFLYIDNINTNRVILSVIQINGFKTVKKINTYKFYDYLYKSLFDFGKKFCFMHDKTLIIFLDNILLIDLNDSDNICEIENKREDQNTIYRLFYDENKRRLFAFTYLSSINEIELDKKEKKIKIIDNLILTHKDPYFLFLLDNYLFAKDDYSGPGYKINFITYFFYK